MSQPAVLIVYLPSRDMRRLGAIAPGSGIVGADEGERITVDYEGAIYGQANLAHFADRVYHAADRQSAHYPTMARLSVKRSDLLRIGTWDQREGEVCLDNRDAEVALAEWLGDSSLDPAELRANGFHYEMRRELRTALHSGDAQRVATARFWAKSNHFDISDL